MQKLIFLDFDGVMNSRMYNLYRDIHHLPEKDEFGVLFDPDCVAALKHIIDETRAEIVGNHPLKYRWLYKVRVCQND